LNPYILSALGGYVLGSIPLGYLLVKHRARVDIRTSGSGNVGAYNAGVVTGSTMLGITVGILDGSKGLAAVLGAWFVFGSFWPAAIALLASVLGHIAPVWLRWKGGRGLATACGGFFCHWPGIYDRVVLSLGRLQMAKTVDPDVKCHRDDSNTVDPHPPAGPVR
jgi:glycerol-3-phosphate acyltransferase PlsY